MLLFFIFERNFVIQAVLMTNDKTRHMHIKMANSNVRILQFVIITGCTIIAGVFFAMWSMRSTDSEMRKDLIQEAQIVGNAIDWRFIQKLTATEDDLNAPAYIRLKEQLSLVRSANPLCRFIYLMGHHEDGSVYFFLDSESAESDDNSPPGEIYTDATEILKNVFISGKPATEGPVPDEWGIWVSAIVPLIEPQTNEILAILGMDIDAHEWRAEIFKSLTVPISVTLIILFTETIFFVFRIRNYRENKRLAASRELLSQSEARYRQLFEHAPAGIYEVDYVNNHFSSVNDVMSNYVGYTKEELLQLSPSKILAQDSQKEYFEKLEKLKNGEVVPLIAEYKAITKYGDEFWILVNTQYLFEGNQLIGSTGVIHDITDRKLTEQALIKANELAEKSNKLKDAFITNISHEIRTPLNSILGFSDLLPDMISEENQEPASHIFEIINISGKRLMRTVDMIMNFSRLQVGEFPVQYTDVNLAQVLETLTKEFKILAQEKSLNLIFENHCGDAILNLDEYCITQAVYDLVDNAIKFTPEGYVKVSLNRKDNSVVIDIEDTGIGISEEYLSHLFEPFSQEESGLSRTFEGVGLGLSIVKKLLDLIHAEITVESTKGQGTTFHISLNTTSNSIA
jgi:PAS domain S-box-containing protein